MSQDPAFRMSYEARQKALIDEASKYKYAEKGIEKGRKEGKEEGLQEGIEKGKIQLIRGMHKMAWISKILRSLRIWNCRKYAIF